MEQDLILKGNVRDLGGFAVVRSIPQAKRRHVGPFVFLDHMGPMKVDEYHKLDVRPHPHIGLSTVTYLLEGRGHHRDSLGSDQVISPGDINWMTAGRGIVHSERTPCSEIEAKNRSIHGIQVWVALPVEHEESEPAFFHYPKDQIPKFRINNFFDSSLLIGSYGENTSPVKTYSPTIFMELSAKNSGVTTVSFKDEEIGIFLVKGSAKINNQALAVNDIIIVKDPSHIEFDLSEESQFIVIGGSAFKEPRYIWWNFVSSSKERIREAAALWEKQEMGQVPTETDFIPLPNIPLP